MKSFNLFFRVILILSVVFTFNHQLEGQGNEPEVSFDVGADLVSNYVWRGTKYGAGPQVQPYVEFSAGNLAIGSWGSYGFAEGDGVAAFAESDLYISYGFDFGLSLGVTDYYYPGTPYFDYSSPDGSHGIEANLGYEAAGFSIGANYMINEAGGAGTAGGDMYFELGYSFESVTLFVGGGNGWHTSDGEFALCNVGLSVSKELPVTEEFSLPVSGALILNPESEQYHIVFAVSF